MSELTQNELINRLSLEQSIGLLNAQAGDRLNVEVKLKSLKLFDQLKSANVNERLGILEELERTIGQYDSTDPMDERSKRNILQWLDEMKREIKE